VKQQAIAEPRVHERAHAAISKKALVEVERGMNNRSTLADVLLLHIKLVIA